MPQPKPHKPNPHLHDSCKWFVKQCFRSGDFEAKEVATALVLALFEDGRISRAQLNAIYDEWGL